MHTLVICCDLDGTLLDADNRIHPHDRALLGNGGAPILVPATGRPLHSLRWALEANRLFVGQPIPLPLIVLNGGAVYLPGEQLVSSRGLEPDVQAELLTRLPNFPEVTFLIYTMDAVYVLGQNDRTRPLIEFWRLAPRPYDPDTPRAYMKVLCLAETSALLEPFAASIADLPLACALAMPGVMEVTSLGVDKARAASSLLDALGLDPSCLVAVGDGENDLPLFDLAAVSFCPDTAPEAIRAQADHVIDARSRGVLEPVLDYLAAEGCL